MKRCEQTLESIGLFLQCIWNTFLAPYQFLKLSKIHQVRTGILISSGTAYLSNAKKFKFETETEFTLMIMLSTFIARISM